MNSYKVILFIILSYSSSLIYGQYFESFELVWRNEQLIVGSDTLSLQGCQYCHFEDQEAVFEYSFTEGIDSVWIESYTSDVLLGYTEGKELGLAIEKVQSGIQVITNVSFPAFFWKEGALNRVNTVKLGFRTSRQAESFDSRRIKKSSSTATSKLGAGSWYKIETNKSGVYKLDASFFTSLGIAVSSINGAKVKIYGSGGAMLPQQNDLERPDDMVETSIYVSTQGQFTGDDFVLFYSQQADKITVDTLNQTFGHVRHLYTDNLYYFLNLEGGSGMRVQPRIDLGDPSVILETFNEYYFNEIDNENTLQSGRAWYQKNILKDAPETFSFTLPGIVNNSGFTLKSVVMARAYESAVTFEVSLNGRALGTQTIKKNTTTTSGYYGMTGYNDIKDFSLSFSDYLNVRDYNFQLIFSGDGFSNKVNLPWQTKGYFDYLAVQYQRKINTEEGQYRFRNFSTLNHAVSGFKFPITPSLVWDITDPLSPQSVDISANVAKETSASLREYIVVFSGNYRVPVSAREIPNQNLHSHNTPDLLVVTSEALYESAADYTAYKREMGFDVRLVTTSQIYNEFSSGNLDVSAIRDYVKLLYDRNPLKLKNLALFGSTSYDYKNNIQNNLNHVPIYQSVESLHNIFSYASDDFYGFLEDGDGTWFEQQSGDHEMSIGVGRIPARTNEEAQAFLGKLAHYENASASYGDWRTRVGFLADDGDNNLHVRDAESLTVLVDNDHGQLRTKKMYLDRYVQDSRTSSKEFDEEYLRLIDQGALIVNFTGHGRPDQLAEERMLVQDDFSSMTNIDKLPIYVTATCEFGVFDDPSLLSGGAELVLMPSGGAIAAVTTTRIVYASSNFLINKALYNNLFERGDDSSYVTLGESFAKIKNGSLRGVNNRNFSFLGDPAMRFALPSNKIILEEKNGVVLNKNDNDTLKALSQITLSGVITNGKEERLQDFSGLIGVKVYDKGYEQETIGSVDRPFKFSERTSKIFEGLATVEEGRFDVNFTVPKDISYSFDYGQLYFYAVNEDSTADAAGYFSQFKVGGTSDYTADAEGPQVDLFMDDYSFIDGGITSRNPVLLADFLDENGINISTSSIGHELSIVIDGDEANRQIINEYYTANIDDNTTGVASYPLFNIAEGRHTIDLIAWDTHNNPVEARINFTVGGGISMYSYPNPFVEVMRLRIDHGHKGSVADVNIVIIDANGSLILEHNQTIANAPSVIDNIMWDRTSSEGTMVQAGIYFVKVNVSFGDTQDSYSEIVKVLVTD